MQLRSLKTLALSCLFCVFSTLSYAATTLCSPVTTNAGASHQWMSALGSGCTFTLSQPGVGDLAAVGAGTVLGNATGSSAAPTATSTPVLGVASTTSGSLGIYSSATANAITIQQEGATSAYNFNLPNTVGTAGQVLTSQAGGSTAMTWSSVVAANFTISTQTSNFNVTAANDWVRYDNSGAAGSVTGTLPSAPTAGDNWCFLVATAQTFEVLANTGETINFGGTLSASAGNIQSSTVGSSVCLYFESSTKSYAWASEGSWQVN